MKVEGLGAVGVVIRPARTNLLLTAPFTHPCPTPLFTWNDSESPQYVSYLSVTSLCSSIIIDVTSGSIPISFSVALIISCVHAMKNVE